MAARVAFDTIEDSARYRSLRRFADSDSTKNGPGAFQIASCRADASIGAHKTSRYLRWATPTLFPIGSSLRSSGSALRLRAAFLAGIGEPREPIPAARARDGQQALDSERRLRCALGQRERCASRGEKVSARDKINSMTTRRCSSWQSRGNPIGDPPRRPK